MARPFTAPPGIPADRQAALVAAFDAMVKDPEFLADAKKLKADVNPLSAAELSKLLAGVYATPKSVLQKAAQAITQTK
jgi:tripartite-type tricarboxylate transporter receptor subunit TctC